MSPSLQALAFVLLAATAVARAPGPRLEERGRLEVGGDLRLAADVRIVDEGRLILAVRKLGAAEVRYEKNALGEVRMLLPEGGGGVVIAEHIASSPGWFAAAAPASQLVWMERRSGGASGFLGTWGTPRAPISFFEDIDMLGDRLAVLGLMRSETGMAPDGAIAWTGLMAARGEVALRPLAYALSGVGARPFDLCSAFEIGKIRYQPDGRLLLVPGAEPGVMRYSPVGALERTWDTVRLGVDVRCDFSDEIRRRFGADGLARLKYIDQFTTVDEMVVTAAGPILFLRSVIGRETRWRAVLLLDDGSTEEVRADLSTTLPLAHLRGDARGNRLVLLLRSFEAWADNPGSELLELELLPRDAGATPAKR